MENLFNNGKFNGLTDLGWTFSFDANGKYPVIANRIFETLSDAETFLNGPTAIPGLILRVVEDPSAGKNGAYLIEKDGDDLWMNKIMTGNIDIELSVVWCKKNAQEEWEEVPEGTPGAVQCLKLKHGETITYIPLSKILVLDEYAKIENVNASLAIRDASISKINASMIEAFEEISDIKVNIDDLEDYINDIKNEIDSSINPHISIIDSSIESLTEAAIEAFENIVDIKEHLEIVDSSINKIEEILDNNTVRTITTESLNSFVSLEIDSSTGNPTITLDASVKDEYIVDSSDNGLITAKYLEDRFEWIES